MQIRPAVATDLELIIDLDGTIESAQYLHIERVGEGLTVGFQIEQRPLRSKLIDANAIGEDHRFALNQVIAGIEEGLAVAGEHDGQIVGLAVGQIDPARQTLEILDIRVDYDARRQGLGSAMLFQLISHARAVGLRAVTARTLTSNLPAAMFLLKCGFDLCGVDTHYVSNHDLVKEAVTLFWYAAMD